MYNGRYSGNKSGHITRKGGKLATLTLVLVLLLGLVVGGTVAFLVTHTAQVDNTFTPAEVKISIDENIANNKKTSIQIQNDKTDEAIPVYVRATLVSNWADKDEKICINHSGDELVLDLGENWVKGSDGYYYYTQPVAVGAKTDNLLSENSYIELIAADDGCSLQVEVIASAIQADGVTGDGINAVVDAWGIDPSILD